MEPLHRCCAGLDVHKDTVVACVRKLDHRGHACQEIRTFRTMTCDLLAPGDWLQACEVTHAAMESTGVYWKPVWHLLEDRVELMLVNARHVKQVPGRKSDVRDCAWIAQLLQRGLLKASLVPPRPQQELRELTRQRSQLIGEQARVAQRIQKVLEDANVKPASVATDVLGVSGRSMLRALIAGETDATRMAELAQRKMRSKIPVLKQALAGRVTGHHRFLLKLHLEHYEQLESLVGQWYQRIEEHLQPFSEALQLLVTIPGIQQHLRGTLLAEIGTDLTPFRTSGNNESAGKRKTGRMRKGSRWLREALIQAAWAASRTKHTYLSSRFRRLSARRGRKRAAAALAHTLLVVVDHVLSRQQPYEDLGAEYLDRLEPEQLARRLVKRLEGLGLKVTVEDQSET